MEELHQEHISKLYERWFTAVAAGNGNTVLSLLSSGIDINRTNNKGQTAATVAEECGQRKVLHILRRNGGRFSSEISKVVIPADNITMRVANPHLDEKISIGYDVNECIQEDDSPLMIVIQKEMFESVQKLHLAGANLNFIRKDGYTPLILACENGNLAIARYLVENGSDVNARRQDGWTPVMIATEKRNYEMVELLTGHSANLDLGCNYGITPIFVAVMGNDCPMVQLLLSKKCRTDIIDNRGLTALMHASWQCRVDIVKVICNDSSLLNVQNPNNGRTALHYAALKDNICIIQCLIDAKACLNVIDKHNKTPLNYASSLDIINLLTSHGAYLSRDQWYSSRRQSVESCISSSSGWSKNTVGASSITSFETVFQDELNHCEKVNGTFVTTVTEEAATHVLWKQVPERTQLSEYLQKIVQPLPIDERPKEVKTVEDVVLDKMTLRGYLQRCLQYFLDNHVAGVSSSRTTVHNEMDNHSDGRINYINQNININIENATYVQTGEGSRINVRERSRESVISECDAVSVFRGDDPCGSEDSVFDDFNDFDRGRGDPLN